MLRKFSVKENFLNELLGWGKFSKVKCLDCKLYLYLIVNMEINVF